MQIHDQQEMKVEDFDEDDEENEFHDFGKKQQAADTDGFTMSTGRKKHNKWFIKKEEAGFISNNKEI